MFRLTKKAEYALRTVFHLAYRKSACTTEEIAREQRIPKAFLKKIVRSLSISGVVNAVKGQKGGVTLKVSPEKLSVKEVLEKVDGPLFSAGADGKDAGPFRELWVKCQGAMSDLLSAQTFALLVLKYEESAAMRISAAGAGESRSIGVLDMSIFGLAGNPALG